LWLLNYHDKYIWLISRTISLTNDYLVPSLVFPWVAAKVLGSPFRDGSQPLKCWRYWVGMALLVAVASWISDVLSPGSAAVGSLWEEVGGILRLLLADLPLVVGGVAAAGLVSYFLAPNRAGANLVGQPVS